MADVQESEPLDGSTVTIPCTVALLPADIGEVLRKIGPQRMPSSLAKVKAEVKQAASDLKSP